jgi:hypothetical protein
MHTFKCAQRSRSRATSALCMPPAIMDDGLKAALMHILCHLTVWRPSLHMILHRVLFRAMQIYAQARRHIVHLGMTGLGLQAHSQNRQSMDLNLFCRTAPGDMSSVLITVALLVIVLLGKSARCGISTPKPFCMRTMHVFESCTTVEMVAESLTISGRVSFLRPCNPSLHGMRLESL